MRRTFLILLIGFAFLSVASASNWPRFHGPNGTGIAEDQKVPIQWNEDNILWKTPIPGAGKSSPVVWGDRIFLQSSSSDGKERVAYCIDAKTGKIVWSKSLPGSKAKAHRLNTLASSTPATDGKHVYFMIWNGETVSVYAWDFEGKEAWKHNLGKFTSQHGPGHSPVVYEDKVFITYDMDGASEVFAFNAEDGKIVWKTPRKAFRSCYSAPFVLQKENGGKELIVTSTAGFGAYALDSGKPNWSFEWEHAHEPLRTVASPVYANGILLATSGNGGGNRDVIAVRPGTEDAKASLAWQTTKSFPYVPSMLAKDGYLYTVHDNGIAYCHEAKTGKEVWKERLGSAVSASPVMIGENIFVPTESGKVCVIAAATKFKKLAENDLNESISASPAVANDCIYIRGGEHLFCVGSK